MGCIKRKEEWVLHPFFAFDATSSLTQCYHIDANAPADANVDARVNGPLVYVRSNCNVTISIKVPLTIDTMLIFDDDVDIAASCNIL